MLRHSFFDEMFGRLIAALSGAFIGLIVWIICVFVVRWVILFAGFIFGFDWIPSFFGWGTISFVVVGALVGFIFADKF